MKIGKDTRLYKILNFLNVQYLSVARRRSKRAVFIPILSDHLTFAFHVASTRCSAHAATSNLHVRWLFSPMRLVNTTYPLFANVKLSIRITAPYNLRVSRCLRVVAKVIVERPLSRLIIGRILSSSSLTVSQRIWNLNLNLARSVCPTFAHNAKGNFLGKYILRGFIVRGI